MQARRNPLVVNGWARDSWDRVGKLLSVREGALGMRYWLVRFQGEQKPVELAEGYLSHCPSEFAP